MSSPTDFRNALPAETRTIPYQPLSLLFGAAVCGILTDRILEWPYWVWSILFLAGTAGGLAAHFGNRSTVSSILLLTACASLFGVWHHDRWNRFAENEIGLFARTIGTPVALRGIVREMPRLLPSPPNDPGRVFGTSPRTLFTLRAERLRDGADWIAVSGKVSVVVEGDRDDLRIGDAVQIFGTLSRPTGPQNPGDYDYAGQLRGKRILCVARADSPEAVSVLRRGKPSPGRLLEAVRRRAFRHLERNLSPETAPWGAAMLLGMREGVDEETTQSLLETGTMHILAISGLHIGLLAATVGFVLSAFGVSRRPTAVVLIMTVLVYLLLTDVRPPAIRATVLVCVVSISVFSGRRSYGVNTLCATALIVLVLNPTELFQFGAQLSFLATGAFFWIPNEATVKRLFRREGTRNDDVERIETKHWRIVRAVRRFLFASIQLFLIGLTIWGITMPLILQRIHLLTPIALLVNPLLWFPLSAALLCGFATMIFGSFPILGAVSGELADLSFRSLFGMIAFFQKLGGHYWVPGPPGWWNFVFYSVFVLLTFLPVRRPSARILASLLVVWIAVGFGAGMIRDLERRWSDRLTISVFSVGHGNCVLILTPEKRAIVYDVGCISSPERSADILSRGLWRYGKTRIDAIVVSHADNDHFNGIPHLLERFSVGAVLVSPYMFEKPDPSLDFFRKSVENRKIPFVEVGDGDTLSDHGLSGSIFLHPPRTGFGESDSANAASLVLRFEHRRVGVLLPGDLDGRLTPPFLEREPIRSAIVMVPHHGGRSSQTEQLLRWATPDCLLISAGRFTHRDAVLEEFRRRGYTVRSTFEEGFIEISIDRRRAVRSTPEKRSGK